LDHKSENERHRRAGRSYGDFDRSFRLPEGIAEKDIHAKVAYGVLQVKIALLPASDTTRIPVGGND
jgi:HSP20 family molecular chaperone IbpA